jgi:hypothetical protein
VGESRLGEVARGRWIVVGSEKGTDRSVRSRRFEKGEALG